jgi:hypothetical protein
LPEQVQWIQLFGTKDRFKQGHGLNRGLNSASLGWAGNFRKLIMKAQFHKNQRVYVKPVGTWALIERVVPHWAKGLNEPIRIHYDVGLGREFAAEELLSEEPLGDKAAKDVKAWRVIRARNKWQPSEDCASHPVPGTYPVVVTGEADWGGWRVPGAEYDLNPARMEEQARLIANAPQLASFASSLVDWARKSGEDMPNELVELAHQAQDILTEVQRTS